MRLTEATVLALLLLPLGAAGADLPLGSPPPAGSLFLYPERIPQADGAFIEADRGLLFVPADRSEPGSPVLAVEIYRFPAHESAAAGTPPIFKLHGGPGFRGLELDGEEDFYDEHVRPFVEIADLVVVGQRGIGSSKPDTLCEQGAGFFSLAACKAFWEERGLDLQGLSVIEAAADVRDAARALGYERITLSGGSFGSHWAMAVMRYHPEIVARAVLTGMEGPDHTYDSPGGVLAALERMAAAAEASPRLEGQIPEGGLIEALKAVIARAEEAGTLEVTVTDPESGEPREMRFTASDVRRSAYGYTGSVKARDGMPGWPADILALYRGDYTRLAEARLGRRGGGRGGGGSLRTASFFMLDCGSGISEERLARHKADPAVEVIGPLWSFYQTVCPLWGADNGDEFRESFHTDIPTVIVHGTWDVSTPYENALELAPHFRNGKLVPVVGGSHSALREAIEASPELEEALAEFMRSGDMSGLPEEVVLPPIEWEVPSQAPAAGADTP